MTTKSQLLNAHHLTRHFNARKRPEVIVTIRARPIGSDQPFEEYRIDRRYIEDLRRLYDVKEVVTH